MDKETMDARRQRYLEFFVYVVCSFAVACALNVRLLRDPVGQEDISTAALVLAVLSFGTCVPAVLLFCSYVLLCKARLPAAGCAAAAVCACYAYVVWENPSAVLRMYRK